MPRFVSISQASSLRGAAVVIDVMRAFTVAAVALNRGAREIILIKELERALEIKAKIPSSLACKDGEPQEGFELTNSPAQLLKFDLTDRVIIQRTAAGTQGAVAASHCAPLFCASFVCASATVRALQSLGIREVGYVVTGSDGTAEEDRACAEFTAAKLVNANVDPAPYIARAHTSQNAMLLQQAANAGHPGIDARDVEMCLAVDSISFAMQARMENDLLVLRRAL